MNDQQLALAGSLVISGLLKTALVNSKLHLYQSSLVPTPNTVLADFTSAEADYDGYAAGGETIAAFTNPILDPTGGYSIGSPLVQFETDPAEATPNLIGGWYLVTAGGALIGYCNFGSPQPMQIPGQGIPVDFRWGFPTG